MIHSRLSVLAKETFVPRAEDGVMITLMKTAAEACREGDFRVGSETPHRPIPDQIPFLGERVGKEDREGIGRGLIEVLLMSTDLRPILQGDIIGLVKLGGVVNPPEFDGVR